MFNITEKEVITIEAHCTENWVFSPKKNLTRQATKYKNDNRDTIHDLFRLSHGFAFRSGKSKSPVGAAPGGGGGGAIRNKEERLLALLLSASCWASLASLALLASRSRDFRYSSCCLLTAFSYASTFHSMGTGRLANSCFFFSWKKMSPMLSGWH